MLRSFLLLLMLAIVHRGFSQFYYTDLVSGAQSTLQYKALKTNLVKSMTAQSFEKDGEQTPRFALNQTISANFSQVETNTTSPSGEVSISKSFYKGLRLERNEDSSARISTVTTYRYQADGRPGSITAVTRDAGRGYSSEEVHEWQYQADGKPSGMLKIKDKKDTTVVTFTYDDQGNVAEERWSRAGNITETWYYYYNSKKQLTDIVRYNSRARRMLPDYLFEYDAAGRVTQMTQITAGSSNYLVWKYVFSTEGLKQRDMCYNKQQQLVGRIEFKYVMDR
ncbi:hypothetical protein [Filimonas effusa]|uniref:YD repeat-containing protein n=1 Tax=Filimonas effusa TaxID=2508721 RepID=A0A4Q1DEI7_9BACT|nr:hypothetical protein [Filimonas effusa]RXK87103.1 hypothetical protein ESB13_10045 [Filimonas effusa]